MARLIKEGYDSAKRLAEATPEALAKLVHRYRERIARKFNHATEPKRNQKLAKDADRLSAIDTEENHRSILFWIGNIPEPLNSRGRA